MRVFQGFGALPAFRHAVATVGSFDGVHAGHRALLERLTEHWNAKFAAKQDKLTGAPGQVVGFGKDGTPTAQDALTMEDVNAAIDEAVTGAIEGVY